MKRNVSGKNNPNWRGGKPHCRDCGVMVKYGRKLCGTCRKVFYKNRVRELNPNWKNGGLIGTKYCIDCKKIIDYRSTKCRICNRKLYIGENHPNYNGGKPKCRVCHKLLSHYTSRICRKCHVGKNNFKWAGDIERNYPPEFNDKLRETIRKRDNYECQGKSCSFSDEQHILVYGSNIEVHHIDHNRKNCSKSNLITLCKQCNMSANFNKSFWREFYMNLLKQKKFQND